MSSTRALAPSQEHVLALISAGSTLSAAAESAGVHRNTVHNWRNASPEFRSALAVAQYEKALLWRDQAEQLAPAAIDALRATLTDASVPASVRLKAAQFILALATTPPPEPLEPAEPPAPRHPSLPDLLAIPVSGAPPKAAHPADPVHNSAQPAPVRPADPVHNSAQSAPLRPADPAHNSAQSAPVRPADPVHNSARPAPVHPADPVHNSAQPAPPPSPAAAPWSIPLPQPRPGAAPSAPLPGRALA